MADFPNLQLSLMEIFEEPISEYGTSGIGYIAMHRKIFNHWIAPVKRSFTEFEAWVYILCEANYTEGKMMMGSELVIVKRGQYLTSQDKLSIRFSWDRSKVRRVLGLLESDKMIVVETTSKYTMITVCNYVSYQENKPALKPTEQQRSNNGATLYKKNKEVQEVNTGGDYFKFIEWCKENAPRTLQLKEPITESQFITLKNKYPTKYISDLLVDMENFKKLLSNYVSAYKTFLKWAQKKEVAPYVKVGEKQVFIQKTDTTGMTSQELHWWRRENDEDYLSRSVTARVSQECLTEGMKASGKYDEFYDSNGNYKFVDTKPTK